ncbi:MAG: hypothetical protein R3E41_12090 [Burkholderiaceae bacterium]
MLLALLLGLWVPYATRRMRRCQPPAAPSRGDAAVFAVVLVDIVRSCIHVSAIILGSRSGASARAS